MIAIQTMNVARGLAVISRRQLWPAIKKLKGKSPLQAVEFERLSKLF